MTIMTIPRHLDTRFWNVSTYPPRCRHPLPFTLPLCRLRFPFFVYIIHLYIPFTTGKIQRDERREKDWPRAKEYEAWSAEKKTMIRSEKYITFYIVTTRYEPGGTMSMIMNVMSHRWRASLR